MESKKITSLNPAGTSREKPVIRKVEEYLGYQVDSKGGSLAKRQTHYDKMVGHYYDLVTDFYEFGWGESFHFAPRGKSESFEASLARHQHFLAQKLNLKPCMRAMDLGCGIGGPMRSIARFSEAHITGVNINGYQTQRVKILNQKNNLNKICEIIQGDFMRLPFGQNVFDAGFAIESTAHAPDKKAAFSQVFHCLKKNALFAGYEWCLTAKFNPEDLEHCAVKKAIEEGNGLPDIPTIPDFISSLKAAGFEVIETNDQASASDPETPWYLPLSEPGFSLKGLRCSRAGRWLTNNGLRIAELFGWVPKGSRAVSTFLNVGADALWRGGELGIFTPMLFFLVRKPGN